MRVLHVVMHVSSRKIPLADRFTGLRFKLTFCFCTSQFGHSTHSKTAFPVHALQSGGNRQSFGFRTSIHPPTSRKTDRAEGVTGIREGGHGLESSRCWSTLFRSYALENNVRIKKQCLYVMLNSSYVPLNY